MKFPIHPQNRSHLMNKIKFIQLAFLTAITLMTGIAFTAEDWTTAYCDEHFKSNVNWIRCMQTNREYHANKQRQRDNANAPSNSWNEDIYSNAYKHCLENPSTCNSGGYIQQYAPPVPPKCIPQKQYEKTHTFVCQGIDMYGNIAYTTFLGRYSNCENGFQPGQWVGEYTYPNRIFVASACFVKK